MKKQFYTILLFLTMCTFIASAQNNAMVHTHIASPPYPVDTWYLVNDGLAPCATTNGPPNGLYDVATHGDFTVNNWSHRRGEMYAELSLPNCSRAWYRHDTVINRWMRVAESFQGNTITAGSGFYTTNGENIFSLADGRVYQMVEFNEYTTYPTGWKEISKSQIIDNQIWSNGCNPTTGSDVFARGARAGAPEAIGDTIFTPFLSEGCPTENKIGKFSIKSGTWTFLTLSGMPWDLYPSTGGMNWGENYGRAEMIFTFPIAGRFQIFFKVEEPRSFGFNGADSMLAVPSFMWAYDYGEPDPMKKWKNISEGPDHNNATGTSNPYGSNTMPNFPQRPRPNPACINPNKTPISTPNVEPCDKHNNWAVPKMYISFDKKKIYATTGSVVNGGIYYWNGSGWTQQVSDILDFIRPTNNGVFYKVSRYSDNQFYQNDGPLNMKIGQIDVFCGTDGLGEEKYGFRTPDDGKTWYLYYTSGTGGCSSPTDVGGMYRLQFNTVGKAAATRNLHLNTGTYVGAPGDNYTVGVGVGGDYQVIMGLNSNAGTVTSKGPFAEVNLPGANSLSPGKVVFFNFRGDSVIRVVNIGNRVDEIEVQDVAPFRIAVTGDFGVRVLDSTGTTILWEKGVTNLTVAGLPASGLIQVDISNSGQVVVARGTEGFNGRAVVFSPTGVQYAGVLNPGRNILHDVTIKNDTVALVGEDNRKMVNWCGPCGNFSDGAANGGCPNETNKNWPIRVPYIFFYAISGGAVNTVPYAKTYDFNENKLQPDAADAKIKGASFGKNGKLYVVGEHAGPNSVLRWNGKTNYREWYDATGKCGPPTPLQRADGYSRFSVTLKPVTHIGFVGLVNPTSGLVENGTILFPLKGDGTANTLKLYKVSSDAKGYIYAGGDAAARTKGRDLININGKLVGPYAGDVNFLMLSPDFKTRMFWGPLNATGSGASGTFGGVGMRDNIVALGITSTKGTLATTDNAIVSQSFNSTNTALRDAYLGVFYQDVWNHAKEDSVQDKDWPSDTIADITAKADFDVDKRQVCINQPVTFINQSIGDSILTWDFGAGASLLPGTQGKGPFTVTYNSIGFKTPRLNAILKKSGLETYSVKDQYIQVLQDNVTLSGSISGPVNVCPGSEAVYSVPITQGITFYEWSFPTGAQIVYGAGGPSVRVVFAGSGTGTVSVKGKYACGETQTLSLSVNASVKSANKVLIVGKEKSLNTVMTFDGSGDYFQSTYTGVSGPGVSTPVSVEFWMRTPSNATLPSTIVSWGSTGSAEMDVLIDSDGLIRIERGNQWYKANFPVNDGQWHHVAISIQPDANNGTDVSRNPRVFIDGQLRTRADGQASGGTVQDVDALAPVRIGITSRNSSRPFRGEIDDLRIWSAELNANDIISFLGTTDLLSHPKYSSLQYQVHNDPANAVIATDYSQNNYTSTAFGDAKWVADPAYQADLALKTKLEAKGFMVEILKAGEISNDGNEANCAGLVYVSSTVVQAALGQKLLNVAVPVIVAQPGSYNAMGMVPAGSGNWGGLGSAMTQINITDITTFSVLASNIPAPAGNKDVYTSSGEVYWGRPLPSAISVAQTTGSTFNKTLFGYEAGATLVGSQQAPARRVGFFLNTYDLGKLKPQFGDSLLNRAICWALNNCPTPNTITTNDLTKAVYCPGDTITVPFTTTGTFALTGTIADLPNSQVIVDAGSAGSGANQSPQVTISSGAPSVATGGNAVNGDYYSFKVGAQPASVNASLAWTPNVPYTGVYKVEYFVPNDAASLNTAARLRLSRPGEDDLDTVFSMQASKGSWAFVGNRQLPQGLGSSFRILNNGPSTSLWIVADAIRLTLVSLTGPEGNDFTLQLSDKNGSFTSATTIGVLQNNNSATSMKGVLPTFIPAGGNYRVRVLSNAPPVVGTQSNTAITISANAPEPTGPILGNAIACAGATVQGYKVVANPTGAQGYLWEIPLGAQFLSPNDRDTVTIKFTTATTNDISVRKVGECGTSAEQTLKITLAAGPPAQPDVIAGRTIVCNSLKSEIYTITPVTGAASYTWTLPAGASAVGSLTGNSITVNYTNAAQAKGKITVKAVNDCGESPARELDVTVDNGATLPVAGPINGVDSLCPNTPNQLYSVAPVPGATNYLWSVSGVGASIDTTSPANKNQAIVTFGETDATISVSVVDACGISTPSTLTVKVAPSAQKRALVITSGSISSPNTGDTKIRSMLQSEGYTVAFKSSGFPLVADDYCYTVAVISPSVLDNCNDPGSGGDVTTTRAYRAMPIPVMVMNPFTFDVFGIGTSNCGTSSGSTVNIINSSHPLANGLSAGSQTILSSAQNYVRVSSIIGTPVATTGTSGQNLIWAIDAGTNVPANNVNVNSGNNYNFPGYTAKSRIVGWVPLGHHDRGGSNPYQNNAGALNTTGENLFKRAICWLTNSCDPLTITLTGVNKPVFCAGEQISTVFTATGAIGASNVFELQLSDPSGSFTSPTVLGTLASNTAGVKTITVNMPLTLVGGTGYAIRIRATNAVTLSTNTLPIAINSVPGKASAITGNSNVCPGQASVNYSVTNVPGVTYTWTLPVGASIVSGQGTSAIVANMSGASSGSVSVTTASAGGCVNTDAQILPLTFTSSNNWTGAVNTEWHNPGNWSCGFLPNANSDVTISNVGSGNYPVVSVAGALARNLTINGSSASVTIANGGTLSLNGNLTRTAGNFTHTGGTLIMNGTTPQIINIGQLTSFANLTINNPAGVSLGGTTNSTLTGTLNFVNGRFDIGSSNLILGNNSNILGAGATRYIVVPNDPAASNYVQKQLVNGGLEYTFPIGNATTYNPVSITNSGTTSDVQVRTFAGVLAAGTTGAAETGKAVNRTWSVKPINTDANLSIKFQWSNTEHLPEFLSQFATVRTNPGGGTWNSHTPIVGVSGSGVLNMSASGVTGAAKFPYFSIASTNSDLPPIISNTVVMVVGSTSGGSLSMTKGDTLVRDSLKARGFVVAVISDVEDAPSDVNSAAFVWIASSVDDANISTKYQGVLRPVVINAAIFQNMGLTFNGSGSTNPNGPSATVVNNTHPLGNGSSNLGAPGTVLTAHSANVNFLTMNNINANAPGGTQTFITGIAYDSSGNDRNAAMAFGGNISSSQFVGFWASDPAPGRNTAVEFNSSQGRNIQIVGYNGPLNSALSFSAWIKPSGDGTIVSWGTYTTSGNAGKSIAMNILNGKLRLDFGGATGKPISGSGAEFIQSTTNLSLNQWHHVAFSMPTNVPPTNSSVKLYVDGAEVGVTRSGTTPITLYNIGGNGKPALNNFQNVRFGGHVYTNAQDPFWYSGLMDDVAIWNTELTASEVQAIYTATDGVAAQKSMYPQQANLQFETDFTKVRDAAVVPILEGAGNGSGASKMVFVGFEKGGDLWNMIAPGKRIVFPYTNASYTSSSGMTATAATRTTFSNILSNTLCWIMDSCATMIEINTLPLTTEEVCQGDTVNVSFKSVNTFKPGNVFTVELSDATGSFTSPVNIGTFASEVPGILPIKTAIPATTAPGTGYRIRVISSNPVAVILTDNGKDIVVKSSISIPGAISGPSTVCSGQSNLKYSITPVSGATFYTWVLPSGATGTSIKDTITVNMGTATAGMIKVSASNGTCATPTSDLPLNINSVTTWTGGSSDAWHVGANWECGQVPTINSDVVIPATATNMPTISTTDAVARDLTVTNGGVISFTSGGTLNLKGNLTLNGANALNTAPSSCGTVVFSDTIALQTITADDTARFCNLTVANPMNVQLLQHARVSGVMDFVRGKFLLHNSNLVMGSGATITGADSLKYIVGNNIPLFANSFLIRPVGATAVEFPVGSATVYNPARISNTGTVRPMKVRTFPQILELATSGTAIPGSAVKNTWEIEPVPAVAHGVVADITLRWRADQELLNFIDNQSYVRKHKGGLGNVWEDVSSTSFVGLGAGYKEITATGVATFSKFGVFSTNASLPLSLLEFVGYNINGEGVLYWKTTDQVGASYFEIEKSGDGVTFEYIGTVDAKSGSVNEYGFTDSYLIGNSYYRLRIVDIDGAYEYSPLVLIRVSSSEEGTFSLFPNPAKQSVTIGYDGALKTEDYLRVRMFTVPGVELLNVTGNISQVNAALNRRMATAAAGMYMVQIILNNEITTFKLIKEE